MDQPDRINGNEFIFIEDDLPAATKDEFTIGFGNDNNTPYVFMRINRDMGETNVMTTLFTPHKAKAMAFWLLKAAMEAEKEADDGPGA